jgi:hypothetical protein
LITPPARLCWIPARFGARRAALDAFKNHTYTQISKLQAWPDRIKRKFFPWRQVADFKGK